MTRYYIGLLKKLTVPRFINFIKLWLAYHISKFTGKVNQFGKPLFISIEPTTSCNLRCPQCPSGLREFTRPTGMLQKQIFEKVITELKRTLHTLTFYFQGEPYLHPTFTEMVSFANSNNIYTSTSTNAHYLTEENARKTVLSGLDKLVISIDGIRQESYSSYRVGGQLEKVLSGTKNILAQKKLLKSSSPHVVWQFVVFRNNEKEIEGLKKLGRELGVDEIKIKTAQIYDFENSSDLIPENEKLSRYKMNAGGNYEIKNKLENKCWRMWQGCVVTWDGKIVPCCFDKDAHYKLGDLETSSFMEVWRSEAYNKFRGSVLKSRKEIDICTNCTEGTEVFASA